MISHDLPRFAAVEFCSSPFSEVRRHGKAVQYAIAVIDAWLRRGRWLARNSIIPDTMQIALPTCALHT